MRPSNVMSHPPVQACALPGALQRPRPRFPIGGLHRPAGASGGVLPADGSRPTELLCHPALPAAAGRIRPAQQAWRRPQGELFSALHISDHEGSQTLGSRVVGRFGPKLTPKWPQRVVYGVRRCYSKTCEAPSCMPQGCGFARRPLIIILHVVFQAIVDLSRYSIIGNQPILWRACSLCITFRRTPLFQRSTPLSTEDALHTTGPQQALDPERRSVAPAGRGTDSVRGRARHRGGRHRRRRPLQGLHGAPRPRGARQGFQR